VNLFEYSTELVLSVRFHTSFKSLLVQPSWINAEARDSWVN